jgi:hypothetical protein
MLNVYELDFGTVQDYVVAESEKQAIELLSEQSSVPLDELEPITFRKLDKRTSLHHDDGRRVKIYKYLIEHPKPHYLGSSEE